MTIYQTTDVRRHACVRVSVWCRFCACVRESYHLVRRVVGLQLLVGGVLDVDRVVPDQGGDGGVVAHHGLGALLAVQLQERLHARTKGQRWTIFLSSWGKSLRHNPAAFF